MVFAMTSKTTFKFYVWIIRHPLISSLYLYDNGSHSLKVKLGRDYFFRIQIILIVVTFYIAIEINISIN